MRKEIKSILELIPFLLVIESIICFLLSFFDFYANIFERWEDLTECSLLMCVVFYSISENWGLLAKKSIVTLFLLNVLNFSYGFINSMAYYGIFQSLIYSFFIFTILYHICEKN